MKVLYNWLREFVDAAPDPAELAERLTLGGLEVETLARLDPGPAGLIVGRILSVEPHPNADRLSVCRVSDGARELTVVCGAPNVRAGETAPLAVPGVKLPDGTVLGRAKLRGVASEGMLCSERELGFGEDAAGIMLLGSGAREGRPLTEALGLDDWLLDVNVTPNRPDCLSVVGIAREVSAICGLPLFVPAPRVEETGSPAAGRARVVVERADLCPRYTVRLIENVRPVLSPFRVRRRLGLSGVRAVNAVVDATNYVLLEYGQPLHAFDFAKIRGGRVTVRAARAGERIVTIDGKERELAAGMLLIADDAGPVAVAGVMGGAGSEVGPETSEILLESACFAPVSVRRTSRALDLASDSSYRFERGTDIDGTATAADRAAQLIAEFAGGKVCAGTVECRVPAAPRRAVSLRLGRVNAVLGGGVARGEAAEYLARLGIEAREGEGDRIEVVPPARRVDLRREIDLIEEIARLRGYDRIPEVPPSAVDAAEPAARGLGRARAREALRALGFSEAVTLSFMGEAEMDRLMWAAGNPLRRAMRLTNAVSEELSLLRTSLLPSLMRCLGLNASRGNHDVRLFELGAVFSPTTSGGAPVETEKLALAATGLTAPANWHAPGAEADFFFLKGVVESLVEKCGPRLWAERVVRDGFHPGRTASLFLGDALWGCIGELHPRVAEAYGVRGRVIFAEVDAVTLYAALAAEARYRALPGCVAVRRDVAVVADEGLEAARLVACAREAAPRLVDSVTLFDVFTGAQIPAGKKGLAFAVRLRSPAGTLTEEEMSAAMERIRAALRGEGCEIR